MKIFKQNATEKLEFLAMCKQRDIKSALKILKPYIPKITKVLDENKDFEKHFKFMNLHVDVENFESDESSYISYSPFEDFELGEINIALAHTGDYVDINEKCILKITIANTMGRPDKNLISTKFKYIKILYNEENDKANILITKQSYKYYIEKAEEEYGKEIKEKEIEL